MAQVTPRKAKERPLWSVVEVLNAGLIAAVAEIWVLPDDSGMDVTWGEGRWKTDHLHRPELFIKHDLYTLDGVDFCQLPEAGHSTDVCLIMHPPYTDVGSCKSSVLGGMYDGFGLEPCRGWAETAELINRRHKGMCPRPGSQWAPVRQMWQLRFRWPSSLRLVRGVRRLELLLGCRSRSSSSTTAGAQPKGRRVMHSASAASYLLVAQKPPLVHPLDLKTRQ